MISDIVMEVLKMLGPVNLKPVLCKVIICYINFGGTRHENIYGKHSKC